MYVHIECDSCAGHRVKVEPSTEKKVPRTCINCGASKWRVIWDMTD